MFRFKLKDLILIFVLIAVIVFTFWDLPNTFFQQDEWWGFGDYIYSEGLGGPLRVIADQVLGISKVHFNPLTSIVSYLQFRAFRLNFPPYAYSGIATHIINSLLVWYFINLLFKNKKLSFFPAFLFGIYSISHQGVSWVAANVSVEGALLFSLISLILFVKYVLGKQDERKFLCYSLLFLLVALLFKETAFSLFLFMPFLWLILVPEKKIQVGKQALIPLILFGSFYGIMRVILIKLAPPLIVGQTQLVTQPNLTVFIYRLIALPFKILPQTFFPQLQIIDWANSLARLAYPNYILADGFPNPYIAQSIVFDLTCYLLSALIIVLLLFTFSVFKKKNKTNLIKGLFIAILFIIISGIPLIFIPGKAGFTPIFEPRHLYLPNVGSSALIVLFFYALSIFLIKNEKKAFMLTVFFLIPISILHIFSIRSDLKKLEKMSVLRKSFLTTISDKYPLLPQRVIFYTESDQAYYGLPENEKILPVQSGFGRMIGIWYNVQGQFPSCYFKGQHFYDILEEDYQFCQNRGFGYFRNYNKLFKTIKLNKLEPQDVIAFSWNGKTEEFKDITFLIRKKIAQELLILLR